ncbi:hypothetical protein ACH5RR_041082 [Cinchona calisaya]|uniref:Uncharacterized protein n=1 Tax=Cinchona calisaya TaxID=153742 RepID=A0ABD2XVY1_9GENT
MYVLLLMRSIEGPHGGLNDTSIDEMTGYGDHEEEMEECLPSIRKNAYLALERTEEMIEREAMDRGFLLREPLEPFDDVNLDRRELRIPRAFAFLNLPSSREMTANQLLNTLVDSPSSAVRKVNITSLRYGYIHILWQAQYLSGTQDCHPN